jgi:hypothetical protein
MSLCKFKILDNWVNTSNFRYELMGHKKQTFYYPAIFNQKTIYLFTYNLLQVIGEKTRYE